MDYLGPAVAASKITSLNIASNFLSKKSGIEAIVSMLDNGALTSLHVGQNGIPEKEMREIMAIAMRIDSIKILCEIPFKDKTITELDVSGKKLDTEGALVVAEYLDGNGALTQLDISKNGLCAAGTKVLAEALSGNKALTELNLAGNYMGTTDGSTSDLSGVATLANTIKDMGAMTSLNLASNALGVEGAKIIAACLPKCT
jgi:Ran GTPase-activating protein (RanGAP) involved in mRNA processing and transport